MEVSEVMVEGETGRRSMVGEGVKLKSPSRIKGGLGGRERTRGRRMVERKERRAVGPVLGQ